MTTDSSSIEVPSLKGHVSAEEWQTRVDLAATYRLVAHFGWDDLVFSHLTARVPGTENFLINPYGLMFDEITASHLIKVDMRGRALQETPFLISHQGIALHGSIYEARKDVNCVLHTHTIDGAAVSCQSGGLLPISQLSMYLLSRLSYHDYEGEPTNNGKSRLTSDLGDNTYLVMRNHGLLTAANSIPMAFEAMYFLESACAVQLRAQAGGTVGEGDLIELQPKVRETLAQQLEVSSQRLKPGDRIWPAMLRRADRLDPGFRS